jgi:sugar lactone lactonase YvrE
MDKGISHFDGETWTTYSEAEGLISDYVHDVAVDHGGGVWIGTSHGVSYFKDGVWTHYTKEDGLCGNTVAEIIVDDDGIIWFGTKGGGVCRYLPAN